MGLSHSPSIVTANLLLNVDATNPRNYDGTENYFRYSEELTNATWGINNIGASVDTSILPPVYGMPVYKMTESTDSVSSQHLFAQSPIVPAIGDVYTLSCYVKAGTRTAACITAFGEGYSAFNLTTGTVIQSGGNIVNIFPADNGWYRIFATITKTNTTAQVFLIPWNGGNSYIGNGSYFYATLS